MKTTAFSKRFYSHLFRFTLVGFLLSGLTMLGCFTYPAAQTRRQDDLRATLRVLSAQAHLMSGGDVLLQVEPAPGTPLDQVQVTLNGEDVTALFRPVSSELEETDHILRGLVLGLEPGEHVLAVAVLDTDQVPIQDAGTELTLTNWPISGPLISGPHEVPFFCQTETFQIGPDLGVPLSMTIVLCVPESILYTGRQTGNSRR